MADYQSDRTGASIDTVLDNADAGNIGKTATSSFTGDVNDLKTIGFFWSAGTNTNMPVSENGTIIVALLSSIGITQHYIGRESDKTFFRRFTGGTWQPWREIYHDNGNGVTAAQAATAIKGAKDGNIGVSDLPSITNLDLNTITQTGWVYGTSTINSPIPGNTFIVETNTSTVTGGRSKQFAHIIGQDRTWIRHQNNAIWSSWQELYHTGNTGVVVFESGVAPPLGSEQISISPVNNGAIDFSRSGTALSVVLKFFNGNGEVGSVKMSGTSTQFNTSSDNRLKDVIGKPSDAEIDAKFNDIYDTFTIFNWKNDVNGNPVWGFLAHDVIDKGLDFASEGEGGRDLAIGDVYETIPAVYEDREQQKVDENGNPIFTMVEVLDEDGNALLDEDGNPVLEQGEPVMEMVSVEVTPEQVKKVTPAGVDQSKITAYLVPFAELQKRRIDELESELAAMKQRLDAAGL